MKLIEKFENEVELVGASISEKNQYGGERNITSLDDIRLV